MNPIHPVSFQSVLTTLLNQTERQPGRDQVSSSNQPRSEQRVTSIRSVQRAVGQAGVPDRVPDTEQTGSNLPRRQNGNGSDSATSLNKVPSSESTVLPVNLNAFNLDLSSLVETAAQDSLAQLQTVSQEIQKTVKLSDEVLLEIHQLINLVKQITDDSEVLDQLMQNIDQQFTQSTTSSDSGGSIKFSEQFTLALTQAQQEQAEIIQQEAVTVTNQFEITLSSQTDEQGNEIPQSVLRVQMNGAEVVSTEVVNRRQSDPLVLDLDGDGIELSKVEDGVLFDINADGLKENTAFVTGEDAFLALDRNLNGLIDNGSELFGDQNGAKDGFAELRKFDGNNDGIINERDAVFTQLVLFNDKNRDGYSQLEELHTLKQQRIEAILLDSVEDVDESVNGNPIIKAGTFVLKDGAEKRLGDALLNYLQ